MWLSQDVPYSLANTVYIAKMKKNDTEPSIVTSCWEDIEEMPARNVSVKNEKRNNRWKRHKRKTTCEKANIAM